MTAKPPLTVAGTLEAIEEIERYLAAACEDAGLGPRDAYKLRLAVDEVATNVIVHGYQEHGLAGSIVVRADVADGGVTVTLEDTGPAFDPRSRAMPVEDDLAASIDERTIGGLGIFLAIKNVDEFRYERRDATNINTFVVRRRAADAPH